MSDSATATGDAPPETTPDTPLGLRSYHWALVVALAVVQLPGVGVETAAGAAGALIGTGAVSLAAVYVSTAAYRRLSD